MYDLLNKSTLDQPQKYDKEFGKSLDPGKVISGTIYTYKSTNNYLFDIVLHTVLIFQCSRHF